MIFLNKLDGIFFKPVFKIIKITKLRNAVCVHHLRFLILQSTVLWTLMNMNIF